ncbi:hypothetical protein D9M68_400110 [compost metagenome]
MHEHDAARDVAGKAHLVGHDQHGPPFLGEPPHDAQHLAHQFRVERRGGFVEQHRLRAHGKRAGNRRALLLAAGEMRGIVVALVGDADLGKQRLGLFHRLGARTLQHMHRRLDDVFEHGLVGPEIEALEHHAELERMRSTCF